MERTDEDRYTDLLRHLGNPSVPDPEGLIASLRAVERMYALGHIIEWQLEQAKMPTRRPCRGSQSRPRGLGQENWACRGALMPRCPPRCCDQRHHVRHRRDIFGGWIAERRKRR
jgi:hypothetical protein